jgi:phage tail sheath gpL-like
MPISFSNIPADLRIPLYWVEVDPSKAGIPMIHQPSLIVGVMTSDGVATPGIAIACGSQAQADNNWGPGSEIAQMFHAFYANNFANEVWGLGVAEPTGAVAATGTITVTTPPTEAGTIHLYIGGRHQGINIGASDTADEIAYAIAAEINDTGDMPVLASANVADVVLTCRWKGVNGNDIRVETNYYGTIGGEQTPVGLVLTLPAGKHLSGGTGVPEWDEGLTATGTGTAAGTNLTVSAVTGQIALGSNVVGTGVPPGTNIVSQTSGTPGGAGVYVTDTVTTATAASLTFTAGNGPISNLGEKAFEYVALPYTDSTSLNSWEQEYGFEDVGRWGWRRQLYGHVFSARRGTYPDLVTFGNTRNSGVTSILGMEVTMPSPVYQVVAAYVAKAQRALINDPARPLQTLTLNTIKLAPLEDRFDTIELNSLAGNGIATQKAGSDNQPMISRETTTYQLNLYGFRDDAYELVTTLATLARLIRNQRHAITSKFPRVKLADDGTRFGPGQAIVTPGIIKGELIAEYVQDMWVGLVENLQAFKANLIVERDPNDPNRVNVLYGPDLINQLRVFAVLAQFRLQYDRGLDTQIIGPNASTIGMTGTLPSAFGGLVGG